MRWCRHFLALVCLVFAGVCNAQNFDVETALRAGNFKAVEEWLRAVDAALVRGDIAEYDALDAYRPFYQSEDVLSVQMDAWVRQSPRSDIAYLARGTYRRKLGEFRRGMGYAGQVPAANMRYMQTQFEGARDDLDQALKLNPRSYLAMLNRLNIAMFDGDDDSARAMLRLANGAYPRNLLVRARYLVHLEPRWGGSYARMDAFIAESRAAGAPSDVVDLLTAVKLDDIGFSSAEAGDRESAKRSYERALALARNADRRFISNYVTHAANGCLGSCGR